MLDERCSLALIAVRLTEPPLPEVDCTTAFVCDGSSDESPDTPRDDALNSVRRNEPLMPPLVSTLIGGGMLFDDVIDDRCADSLIAVRRIAPLPDSLNDAN